MRPPIKKFTADGGYLLIHRSGPWLRLLAAVAAPVRYEPLCLGPAEQAEVGPALLRDLADRLPAEAQRVVNVSLDRASRVIGAALDPALAARS